MESLKKIIRKVSEAPKKITRALNSGTGNVTPKNSTIKEVAEFKRKQREVEEYEKSFDDNKAA